jgi:hypothetical protein
MVFGGEQSLVFARRALVLELRRDSRYVLLVRGCLFFLRRPHCRSA